MKKQNNNIFKKYLIRLLIPFSLVFIIFCASCKYNRENNKKEMTMIKKNPNVKGYTTYANDSDFLKKYIEVIELSNVEENAKVAVSPALQGRVMTSTALGDKGRSYGWLNRKLFQSKDTLEHINVYGGEERFWLGPEGGQYSIFFKKGTAFNLGNWYTPKLIDLESFNVSSKASNQVTFTKNAKLTNYSGFEFSLGIERTVEILLKEAIQNEFGIKDLGNAHAVAYKTTNILTNTGDVPWKKETGLLSIWLLGMFNPSPNTTVIIPYLSGNKEEKGAIVNDTYFGKVPKERLVVGDNAIYFSGDGEYRSKIGLSPMRAKNICGSYDSKNQILTIVKYNKPANKIDYVNSMWEIQEEPYAGDVINSYNDGVPKPGKAPLGPFYELETSSPALGLNAGESGTHIQTTCHIEGDITVLEPILKKLFGVSIADVENAFN